MKQITTKKELHKLLNKIYLDNICWEIGGYRYFTTDSTDVITRAINREDYTLKKYVEVKVYKETNINIPKLEDILSEMVGSYSVSEEAEEEFQFMMKEFLDKYKIKDAYLDRIEYELVEEYDIKPLIKNILESRVAEIEKAEIEKSKLLKNYKGKLERM